MAREPKGHRGVFLRSDPRVWEDRLPAIALRHYRRSAIFGLVLVFGGAAGIACSVVVSVLQRETNFGVLFSVLASELALGALTVYEYRQVKLVAGRKYGLTKRESVRLNIWNGTAFDESLKLITSNR